jgi:hypothetical protein
MPSTRTLAAPPCLAWLDARGRAGCTSPVKARIACALILCVQACRATPPPRAPPSHAPQAPPETTPPRFLNRAWDCSSLWPRSDEKIARVDVKIRVLVGTDGLPRRVDVLEEQVSGFGEAASQCAMRQRFAPALDANKQPVEATTEPFPVRFER